MRNSQLIVGLVFAAALGFGLGNCGGSSGSSGGFQACPQGSTSTCTQAELNQYSDCVLNACSSGYSACFGPGFKTGSFSGPCASYAQCTSACGCNNQSCTTACGAPSQDCETCLTGNLVTCILGSTCTLPACAGGLPGVGGTAGGGLGGHVGGTGGISGGAGSTGASGTCADLLACCNSIATASIKAQCMSEYSLLLPMGDATCGAAVSGLRSGGLCP